MNEKIKELTQDQWDKIDEALAKWINIGTSTARASRAVVEKEISYLYNELLGLSPPKFEWYDGPVAALKAHPDQAAEIKSSLFLSPMWYTWTIYRVVSAKIVDIKHDVPEQLINSFMNLMENVGICAPFENICICVDRPTDLQFDQENNLHSDSGPAVQFADGWKLYFWHGVSVPAEWIEQKDKVDRKLALTHPNIEERRCLAEILGWDRVIEDLPTKSVDKHADPQIGELLSIDFPNEPGQLFLKVLCGTGRTFVLPVTESRATTAMAAQEWIHNVGPGEYAPEFRT